ncbi:ribosomal RNA small subunit methyltransferase A, partial [Chloroflexota bacterium]
MIKKSACKQHNPQVEPLIVQTKGILHYFGLQARKRLGQHFLIDEEVLKFMVSATKLNATDMVIEIGPGLGILTRELAAHAGQVVTIELDDKLTTILKKTLSSYNNVTIINKDILDIDLTALLREQSLGFPPRTGSSFSYKVAAASLLSPPSPDIKGM